MYAALGAKVVVNDMSKDAAATVVDEITRGQSVLARVERRVLSNQLTGSVLSACQPEEWRLLLLEASKMVLPSSRTLSTLSELFMCS